MQWILSNQALIQTALIFVLLGYSLQIPLRAGVFSFAAGGFFGFGAYTTGVLAKAGWDPTLSAIVAMAAAAVIGLVLSLILSRLRSLYLAMATLAFIFIVKLVAESLPITGGTIGLIGIPRVVTTWHLLIIVAIVSVGMWMLSRGRIARLTEAMRIDEVLVRTAGMSVPRQRHVVFVLSSILGALAGGLQALTFIVIVPDQVGFDLMLTALTILVIGGSRHWYGVIIGAAVVAWLPTWLAVFGYWRPVADGIVVVLLAVFASNGISGVFDLLVNRIRKRREPGVSDDVDKAGSADDARAETPLEVTRCPICSSSTA